MAKIEAMRRQRLTLTPSAYTISSVSGASTASGWRYSCMQSTKGGEDEAELDLHVVATRAALGVLSDGEEGW